MILCVCVSGVAAAPWTRAQANGFSNLHNAKWARVPVINIVGDHARPLQQYNSHPGASHSSPYLGDIEGYAAPVSGWVRRCRTARWVCRRWRIRWIVSGQAWVQRRGSLSRWRR